jgi:hypothetical protein
VATGIVAGAASVTGWAIGAGTAGLANLARNTKERRLALASRDLENACTYGPTLRANTPAQNSDVSKRWLADMKRQYR